MRRIAMALVLAAAVGCQPDGEPGPKVVSLASGTKIDLILLDTVASGDREGRTVPLLVRHAITDEEGNVLIPAGSIAEGEIAASRAAGALSSLMNQPARLAVRLDFVRAADGQKVPVTLHAEAKAEEPLELTRDFTERYAPNRVDEAIARKDTATVLRSLADQVEAGAAPSLDTPETRKMLESVAHALDLPQTAKVLEQNRLGELQKMLEAVQRGGILEAATGGGTVVLESLFEIVNVSGEVTDRIKGVFRGRNIRAYAGTELTALTTAPVEIEVQPIRRS